MILIETVDRTATKRAIVKSKKGWKYFRVTKIGYFQIWNFIKHIEKNIKFYYKNIPKIMKLLPIIN